MDKPQRYFVYENGNEKYYYNVETEKTQYQFPEDGIIFDPDTKEIVYTPKLLKTVTSSNHIVDGTNTVQQKEKNLLLTQSTPNILPQNRAHNENLDPSLVLINTFFDESQPSQDPFTNSTITVSTPTKPKKLRKRKRIQIEPPSTSPGSTQPPEITNPEVKQQLISSQRSKKTIKADEVLGMLDKQSLIDSIHNFQTPDFARRFFKEHRCGGFFSRHVMPIDELISFATEPLKEPLLSSLPKSLNKSAIQIFEDILSYTGVKPSHNANQIPSKIVNLLYSQPALRDEVYFQLVKQTTNCPDQNILQKSWELFLVLATIFPSTRDSEVWIQAHIARHSQDPCPKISQLAHFTFIRFDARCCIGDVYSNLRPGEIQSIPRDPFTSHKQFGVSLYEVMWSQRQAYPNLPFPYLEYLLIEQIKMKNGFETTGLFRLPGNLKLVDDMTKDINSSFDCLKKASIHDLGSLLKRWFRDFANPVVPVQTLENFRKAHDDKKMIQFAENLPKTHMCTLMYLVGFLQECAQHSSSTQMHANNLAIVFGPNIVQVNDNEPGRIKLFSQMGNEFLLQLINEWNTSDIYPLDESYLH